MQNRRHPRLRSVITAVMMAVLCATSAATTTLIARPALPSASAIAGATTLFGPPVLAPLQPPVMPPAPAPAVAVSTGACASVPVLVYHYISLPGDPRNTLGWELTVTPDEFKQQMDWLHAAGGHTITPAQLMEALRTRQALPPHAVVLTFDDGYDNFATKAAPVLVQDGFVGIDYVVSGFIGRPAYMSAAQVKQVAAMGMVIGAHTVHHLRLDGLPPEAAAAEIAASKAALEELLGTPVRDFAYPYGKYNLTVAALVAQAGFSDAVTMDYGYTQCLSQPYTLHRVRVLGDDNVWSFAGKAGVRQPPPNWVDAQLRVYTAPAAYPHNR